MMLTLLTDWDSILFWILYSCLVLLFDRQVTSNSNNLYIVVVFKIKKIIEFYFKNFMRINKTQQYLIHPHVTKYL